jgi:hypothetical protein
MTLNIYRKIILTITFLLAVSATALPSISSKLSPSIGYSDNASKEEEPFKVLVTVAGVEGNCGEDVKITVAYKSETYQLCEGMKDPLKNKELIQYHLKDISLNSQKDKLQ